MCTGACCLLTGLPPAAPQRCDLFTCSMDEVRQHAPLAARRLTSVLLPPQTGVLVPPETSSEPAGSNDGGASDGGKPGGGAAVQEDAQGGRGADSEDFSAGARGCRGCEPGQTPRAVSLLGLCVATTPSLARVAVHSASPAVACLCVCR